MPRRKGRVQHSRLGRPHLYKPEYDAFAVEWLGMGHSLASLAGEIGVNTSTVTNWRHMFAEFDEACQVGILKAITHYENALLRAIAGDEKSSASQLITFALRNRGQQYGWDDRQTVQHQGELIKVEINKRPQDLSDEELADLLESNKRAREILAPALPLPADNVEEE